MTSAIKDECISAYKGAGFQLFPCIILDGKKRPAVRNWQAMDTPAILPDVFGVNLTHEVAVLDYDWRRDPDYDTATSDFSGTQLSKLWKALNLPGANTYIVESTNGYHVYFLKPDDVYLRNRVPGYDAIDIKTGGGFVVGAGSVNPETGFTYKPIRGSADELAEIPIQLLDLIRFDRDAILIDQREIETDDADTQRVFRDYCRTGAPTAIEGSGGDNATYQVACVGRDYGLPENVVLDIMEAFYNTPEKCCPTWDYGELAAKVANAFSYAQNKQGYRSPEARFENVRDTIDVKTRDGLVAEESESFALAYNNGLKWTFDVDKHTGEKIYKPTINNVISWLRIIPFSGSDNPLYKLFRFNYHAQCINFTRPAPWHREDEPIEKLRDLDLIMLKEYYAHKNLHVSIELIKEAIMVAAQDNAFHPVRDYLRQTVWDGVERLDTWLTTYCGADDTEITREFAKNAMISFVARVEMPGCQSDSMLILEGAQDLNKTNVVRVLGGKWYADPKIDPQDPKDTLTKTMGKWIIEMAEMEVLSRAKVEAYKKYLTTVVDTERLPYAHLSIDVPRQFGFIGTINPNGNKGYLKDTTGNRRFWPVTVTQIDIEALKRDRDQLFAEAFHRFYDKERARPSCPTAPGEPWWITDRRLKALASGEQMERLEHDDWYDIIGDWLDSPGAKLVPLTSVRIAQMALCMNAEKLDPKTSGRISEAMRRAGYHNAIRDRVNGKQTRIWLKVEQSTVDYI